MAWAKKLFVENSTVYTAAVGNNQEEGIEEAKKAASVITPVEVAMGEVGGAVSLDLSLGNVFKATVKAATTFKFINRPARPIVVEVLVNENATGGFIYTIEGLEWVNGESLPSTAANAKFVYSLLLPASGGTIAFGGSAAGGASVLLGQTTSTVTAIGENAGGAVTGAATTVLGTNAGAALTTGEANTAVGTLALFINKTGKGNTAIGDLALNKQTGSEATGVGYEALSQSTANFVTAVGSFSQASNTTGTGNTSIGRSSLFSNKTGTNNTAIGASTLEKATSSSNTAVGGGALSVLTTGGENTAIGQASMGKATEAVQNTAGGRSSLGLLTTGVHNVAFGYNAGGALTTQSSNTLIGWEAGAAITESGKLIITAGSVATALVYGDGEKGEVGFHGVKSTKAAAISTITSTATGEQISTAVNQIIAAIKGKGITS